MREIVLGHFTRFLGEPVDIDKSAQQLWIATWRDSQGLMTLATIGMSEVPQCDPKRPLTVSRSELITYTEEHSCVAAAELLRDLGRYPSLKQTTLHWWHSIPLGRPLLPGSSIEAVYLTVPPVEATDFSSLRGPLGRIDILWIVPITAAELRFFNTKGADRFEELLEEVGPNIADYFRPSVIG